MDPHHLTREDSAVAIKSAPQLEPVSFVAENPSSRALLGLVRRVAPSHVSILIEGESGVGKDLVARLVHQWSDRASGPFVAVNCWAFANGVLESELFGHEKGAFTGAISSTRGCFERASGGTLFLDEIGGTSLEFQAKLLRVLQDGQVLRVGGGAAREIDTRLVVATNQPLRDEVASGRFRRDLFFRLNVVPLFVAPLRDRREDILPLARHFLARAAAETGRKFEFSRSAERAIAAYSWPGNVRELENAIERAVVLVRDDLITMEYLLIDPPIQSRASVENCEGNLHEFVEQAKTARVAQAIRKANGNRAEAARALGIDRTTLYRLMRRRNANCSSSPSA